MIIIGKKWNKGAVYIGRGSPLGNPFIMHTEDERDIVCDQYDQWFREQIKIKNPVVINELKRIKQLALKQDVILGCFCAPKRCHGSTIKACLDQWIKHDQEKSNA